jgi:hypothetical protein
MSKIHFEVVQGMDIPSNHKGIMLCGISPEKHDISKIEFVSSSSDWKKVTCGNCRNLLIRRSKRVYGEDATKALFDL